jgi:hypothetical protein
MQGSLIRLKLFQAICLFGALIVFAALYIILAINNRPAGDDVEIINTVRKYGVWDAMTVYWNSWNTRWLSILFLNAVVNFYDVVHSFIVYHFVTIVFLFIAIHRFISSLLLRVNPNPSGKTFYSALLLASFFLVSFNTAENFLWINCNTMYLWSVTGLLFGSAELLKKNLTTSSYLIAAISFFYVGGAFETYAVVALLALIAILIYHYRKPIKDKRKINLLLISVFMLCFAFSFELIGSGWRNRHEILGSPAISSALFITVKAIVKMFIWYIPSKIHWLILFFLLWMGFGAQAKTQVTFRKHFLLKLFIAFCISTFLLLFPSCYLLRETPPFRTWTLVCFLLVLAVTVAGFFTGQKLKDSIAVPYLSSTASFVMLILLLKTCIDQKQITTVYANAFDEREKILLSAQTNIIGGTIELDPLPPPGMLYSAEITSDTTHYKNIHLKDYYQLKASVRKKQVFHRL